MGQGKHFILWLKRCLFKRKKNNSKRDIKSSPCHEPLFSNGQTSTNLHTSLSANQTECKPNTTSDLTDNLKRTKKSVSFSDQVQEFNFEKESSCTSVEITYADIQDDNDPEVQERRARFLAFQKPMPPRAVQRSEAELERALWLVNQKKERASELARLMDLEESEGEEEADALLEPESEQLPRCRSRRSFVSFTNTQLDDSDDDDDSSEEENEEDFDDLWEEEFKLENEPVFEPLPLRFATNVDTRIKPSVQASSEDQCYPNGHPITRRRYFVYCNDRMKQDSYQLKKENIMLNTVDVEVSNEEATGDILGKPVKEFRDNKIVTGKTCDNENWFRNAVHYNPLPTIGGIKSLPPLKVNPSDIRGLKQRPDGCNVRKKGFNISGGSGQNWSSNTHHVMPLTYTLTNMTGRAQTHHHQAAHQLSTLKMGARASTSGLMQGLMAAVPVLTKDTERLSLRPMNRYTQHKKLMNHRASRHLNTFGHSQEMEKETPVLHLPAVNSGPWIHTCQPLNSHIQKKMLKIQLT